MPRTNKIHLHCSNCDGEGRVMEFSRRGDDHVEIEVECQECGGVGIIDVRQKIEEQIDLIEEPDNVNREDFLEAVAEFLKKK